MPTSAELLIGVEIVVFLSLFTTAGVFLFSPLPWLALIPGLAAAFYWNIIHDKKKTDIYRHGMWFLTTPLMLLAVLKQNNVTSEYIQIVLVLDFIMIASRFFATMDYEKEAKAMWFLLSCIVYIPIAYVLYSLPIEKQASMFLLGVLSVYPIIFILKETHILKPDITHIAYSIMDLVSKVGLVNMIHI
jgi:hypothetical protein